MIGPTECIFDTGAGINIVGEGLLTKFRERKIQLEIHPLRLHLVGVASAKKIPTQGYTVLEVGLGGGKFAKVKAVVTPEWSGQLLLGWNCLASLGLNFRYDAKFSPVAIQLSRLAVEVPIQQRAGLYEETKALCSALERNIPKREIQTLRHESVRNEFASLPKRAAAIAIRRTIAAAKKARKRLTAHNPQEPEAKEMPKLSAHLAMPEAKAAEPPGDTDPSGGWKISDASARPNTG